VTSARSIFVCGSLALSLCSACSGRPAVAATQSAPATPAPKPAIAHASGTAQPAAHASSGQSMIATVLETMNASNYTYVRVKSDAGEIWAAAPRFKTAVGEKVVVSLEQPMENFHSAALNRDFPLIYFVSQITPQGETPSAPPAGHPNVGSAPNAAQTVTGVIEPAPGGTTVETIWKARETLRGKTVTVRGKVVKFNGGILGVNWLHIQDGTGKADDHTNDITVTSDDEAQVGDVVTITGVVALNKDLGSGYNYPVIIEQARIGSKAQKALNK
jgi:SH3 domain-containing protein